MPTGMGVANLKFVKGGRKLKKAKHCTILETLIKDEKMKSEKAAKMRKRVYSLSVVKKTTTIESMQKDAPNQMGMLEVDINGKSQGCIMKASMLSCK